MQERVSFGDITRNCQWKKRFLEKIVTCYPSSLQDTRVFRLSSISHHKANDSLLQTPTVNISGVDVGPLIIGNGAYLLK